MIKENIKSYRILLMILIIFITVITYINFNLIKNIKLKQKLDENKFVPNNVTIKKYGYTDIINLLSKDPSIKITNIDNSLENKNLVKIDMNYDNNLKDLYTTLDSFKNEDCFAGIDNIKINRSTDNKQSINFTALFLKNK